MKIGGLSWLAVALALVAAPLTVPARAALCTANHVPTPRPALVKAPLPRPSLRGSVVASGAAARSGGSPAHHSGCNRPLSQSWSRARRWLDRTVKSLAIALVLIRLAIIGAPAASATPRGAVRRGTRVRGGDVASRTLFTGKPARAGDGGGSRPRCTALCTRLTGSRLALALAAAEQMPGPAGGAQEVLVASASLRYRHRWPIGLPVAPGSSLPVR